MKVVTIILVGLSLLAHSNAFSVVQPTQSRRSAVSTTLDMTVLTYGTKKKDFKPGSPLSSAVKALGVPVKYSCKKGDCATCQITLAGRYTKPCVAKVPAAPTLKSLQEKGLEIRA
ncbi:hypothetical protein MPSEU_000887100 [Mayamaea pseudoterrestris]|nr:hypothetical protein MPSEU_000887100 [Mayamaea pseudoterrestris]